MLDPAAFLRFHAEVGRSIERLPPGRADPLRARYLGLPVQEALRAESVRREMTRTLEELARAAAAR